MTEGIRTHEQFSEFFEYVEEKARELLVKDGHHTGTYILIGEDGSVGFVPFDIVIGELMKKLENESQAKEGAFRVVGEIAHQRRCVGYIHICEGYTIAPASVEPGMDPDEVVDQIRKLTKQFGSIRNIPGRLEVLTIASRFREKTRMSLWKIKRLGDDIVLEPHERTEGIYEGPVPSKSQGVDDGIDRTLGLSVKEDEEEDRPPERRVRW